MTSEPDSISRITLSPLTERLVLAFMTGVAFAVRVWAIDSKGLWYDEAATALMAQARPSDIINFHWRTAFEHPPFWQLLMHAWGQVVGESPLALRFIPALAGTVAVPLLWRFVRRLWPDDAAVRILAAALMAIAPVMILYSQEARMYSLVVTLALALLLVSLMLVERLTVGRVAAFLGIAWAMLGIHYYSVMLLAVVAILFAKALLDQRLRRRGSALLLIWLLAVAPLILWMVLAPGFRTTLKSVGRTHTSDLATLIQFPIGLWKDLLFGSVVHQPALAMASLLVVPVALMGTIWAWRRPNGWLPVLAVLLPIVFTAAALGGVQTRYLLFVVPFLFVFLALATVQTWRWRRWAGTFVFLITALPLVSGMTYYVLNYQKSEYREMAAFLSQHATNSELILLEGPRQNLLFKYYADPDLLYEPVPKIDLPDYWPVNAPPIVPEAVAQQVQDALKSREGLWLVLTGQAEVDPGEFLPKYLRAVAYRDYCIDWLDVTLCHYRNPARVTATGGRELSIRFGEGFWLDGVAVGVPMPDPDGGTLVPVRLKWRTTTQPHLDYKVSVRLLDQAGNLLAQTDDDPIGPLLPATTWAEGDIKDGYFVLKLPRRTPAGTCSLMMVVYDPASGAPVSSSTGGSSAIEAPLKLLDVLF